MIYECSLNEQDIYVTAKTSQRSNYNELVDLPLESGYSLITIPLISKDVFMHTKEEMIRGELIGVFQMRMSESNYGMFKSDPINREILNAILEVFTIRYT